MGKKKQNKKTKIPPKKIKTLGVCYTALTGDFITLSMFMTVTHKLKESGTAGGLGVISSAVIFIGYM